MDRYKLSIAVFFILIPSLVFAGGGGSGLIMMGGSIIYQIQNCFTAPEWTGNAAAWESYSIRQVIPTSALTASTGGLIRITLYAATNAATNIQKVSICEKAGSGDVWDCATTPIPVYFSGSRSVNMASGTTATSDYLSFIISDTVTILVNYDMDTVGTLNLRRSSGNTGYILYYKGSNPLEADTANVTGYSTLDGYHTVIGSIDNAY
jgi:hypothetical protein